MSWLRLINQFFWYLVFINIHDCCGHECARSVIVLDIFSADKARTHKSQYLGKSWFSTNRSTTSGGLKKGSVWLNELEWFQAKKNKSLYRTADAESAEPWDCWCGLADWPQSQRGGPVGSLWGPENHIPLRGCNSDRWRGNPEMSGGSRPSPQVWRTTWGPWWVTVGFCQSAGDKRKSMWLRATWISLIKVKIDRRHWSIVWADEQRQTA